MTFSNKANAENILLEVDAYKTGHQQQYPEGTTRVTSNLTPRKSRIPSIDKIVFFGLQGYIKEFLVGRWEGFFVNPEAYIIDYEDEVSMLLGSKYRADHFRKLAKLGYMPLEIRAVSEGTKVPMRMPCLTVENTHPDFYWLPNFIETQLSAEVWHSCTSATIAQRYYQNFKQYANETADDHSIVPFQGHDFSMRGQTSTISAAKSGAGHLLSFCGTDTLPAISYLRKYYGAEGFVGGSVPATEHAVMQTNGLDEVKTFERLLNIYPTGILSVVSDTWDFWKVITNVLPVLKDKILSRNGKLVIRPDSGDPVKILTGNPIGKTTEEQIGLIATLGNIFGYTINSKGYKVLDPHIGAIYGDSITLEVQESILKNLKLNGYASTNVVLGIGSYTYQCVTRDTFGFAVKATSAVINGDQVAIYKNPVTDDGTKKSAKGLIKLIQGPTGILMQENVSREEFTSRDNLLQIVYKDGILARNNTLKEMRKRLQ